MQIKQILTPDIEVVNSIEKMLIRYLENGKKTSYNMREVAKFAFRYIICYFKRFSPNSKEIINHLDSYITNQVSFSNDRVYLPQIYHSDIAIIILCYLGINPYSNEKINILHKIFDEDFKDFSTSSQIEIINQYNSLY